MNISPRDLLAQYVRFSQQAPYVHDIERAHGLPDFLLFAVASRETNMTDERGDPPGPLGHGHGPWQYDDRTPGRGPAIARIDAHDVQFAAAIAAAMLVDLERRFGAWLFALNAYNSGRPSTSGTTGHDYGPDVLDRMAWLQANVPAPNPQPAQELDVQIANTATTAFLPATSGGVTDRSAEAGWELQADGGVNQATDDTPFWGGYFNLPADARNAPRVFLAVTPRRDHQLGYEIRANDGAFYTFGPGLNGFPA